MNIKNNWKLMGLGLVVAAIFIALVVLVFKVLTFLINFDPDMHSINVVVWYGAWVIAATNAMMKG